jgi:hypothetical protein
MANERSGPSLTPVFVRFAPKATIRRLSSFVREVPLADIARRFKMKEFTNRSDR